jgi:hypothetical protein
MTSSNKKSNQPSSKSASGGTQETPQNDYKATNTTITPPAPKQQQGTSRSGGQATNKPVETVYSVSDLVAASRSRFKVPPEVVQVAFKMAKKEKATMTEAFEIIKAFMERKVTK